MSIRPVDLQTLLPKISEVQKAKNVESELQKNNLNINIHKDAQQHERSTQQVTKTEKSEGSKITRDEKHNGKQSRQENGHKEDHGEGQAEKEKEQSMKSSSKFDIRI